MALNENGHEVLDPTPVAAPLNFRPRSQVDLIRQFVREEVSRRAQDNGIESFEEADDFDVGDDYDPRSPWEMEFDPPAPQPAESAPAATPSTGVPVTPAASSQGLQEPVDGAPAK